MGNKSLKKIQKKARTLIKEAGCTKLQEFYTTLSPKENIQHLLQYNH